jgi:hypothetical protein
MLFPSMKHDWIAHLDPADRIEALRLSAEIDRLAAPARQRSALVAKRRALQIRGTIRAIRAKRRAAKPQAAE